MAAQAQGIERTVRDISTMNQLISAAVTQQAEAVEQLYADALSASEHVTRGNVSLRRTVEVNRSSRYLLSLLMLLLGLLLLFYDAFNS